MSTQWHVLLTLVSCVIVAIEMPLTRSKTRIVCRSIKYAIFLFSSTESPTDSLRRTETRCADVCSVRAEPSSSFRPYLHAAHAGSSPRTSRAQSTRRVDFLPGLARRGSVLEDWAGLLDERQLAGVVNHADCRVVEVELLLRQK